MCFFIGQVASQHYMIFNIFDTYDNSVEPWHIKTPLAAVTRGWGAFLTFGWLTATMVLRQPQQCHIAHGHLVTCTQVKPLHPYLETSEESELWWMHKSPLYPLRKLLALLLLLIQTNKHLTLCFLELFVKRTSPTTFPQVGISVAEHECWLSLISHQAACVLSAKEAKKVQGLQTEQWHFQK